MAFAVIAKSSTQSSLENLMSIERHHVRFGPAGSAATAWFASVQEVLNATSPADVLSQAELGFGLSLRHKSDVKRFFAARTLIRIALSEATNMRVKPSRWRFKTGAQGKPAVEEGLPHFEFNASHSGSCIAVAISSRHPVGIDVEGIAPGDCGEILADVLTPRELQQLKRMDRWERKSAFVKIWTVKEAYAKALGRGAAMDFRSLQVSFDPGQPSRAFCLSEGRTFLVQVREVHCAGHPYFCSLTLDAQ
jgi:4'-phosphopantetheinyl transferase